MMMHHGYTLETIKLERNAAIQLNHHISLSIEEVTGFHLSHWMGCGVANLPHMAPEAAMVAIL